MRVAAPIILTIDDFEWLASSLMNFSLTAFFRDFSEQVNEMNDIRDFASRSKYWGSMRNPEVAASAARELLEELRERSGEEG